MESWNEFGFALLKDLISILVLGLLVKVLLEKYKNKLSLTREVNRARVDKISECWETHSELEYQLFQVHSDLHASVDGQISNELRAKCDQLLVQRELVKKMLAKHKFWLPSDIGEKSKSYLDLFDKYKKALCNGRKVECDQLKNEIDANSLNVDQLLSMILKKLK